MGKVHGSLARAGKVKRQTPRVSRMRRKTKPPIGRAKRRADYQRYGFLLGFAKCIAKRHTNPQLRYRFR